MKLIFLILLIFPLALGAKTAKKFQLVRLDPHGELGVALSTSRLNSNSECMVCHISSDSTTKASAIYSNISIRCTACHNKSPHSGLKEHLGRELSNLKLGLKGKIDCISCHRSHREKTASDKKLLGKNLDSPKGASFIYTKKEPIALKKGKIARRSRFPMLKRTCVNCHTNHGYQ
ncbi:MAG: hypothetical protein HOE90_05915 [Bacteriovoracaceae bacterium]|jgi:hypothetical protein|nr:hypothetical protein [Bacteriovoracaceae bacterium]